MKVKTPAEVISNSDPETMNVTSPARSLAVTVSIAVWFSATVKLELDVNTGAVVSTTFTVLVAVPVFPEASVAE